MIKFRLFGFGKSGETTSSVLGEPADQQPQSLPENTQTSFIVKRVLIVDDDPVFLKATTAKLQSVGLQVQAVREASEAIAALGDAPADAVLMDITFQADVCNGGMGSWDGFQIMTWLRGLPSAKGARFIMVTNSDSADDRLRAQKLGAVAYLQKPLDHNKLLAALNASN